MASAAGATPSPRKRVAKKTTPARKRASKTAASTPVKKTTAKKTTARPRKAAPSAAPRTRASVKHVLGPGERIWILSVPYNERAIASAYGARWDTTLRATVFIGRDLPTGLVPFSSQDYSWERWQEDDLNRTMLAPMPGVDKFTLRPHQVEAAATISAAAKIGYRGFLQADDVGLGKTLTAIDAVKQIALFRPVRNVLVVSPLAVVPHWRRSIASAGDGGLRWCVINYDRLKKLLEVPESAQQAKRLSTKNKRIAREGDSLVDWDIVILDESHRLKHQSSQRSQAAARIIKAAEHAKDAPFVIWMSATAGQNPIELTYLSPLLTQVTGAKKSDLKDFGSWLQSHGFHVTCESRYGERWTWTADPRERSRDVLRIHGMLFAEPNPVAIRRLPTDIAGWPEIIRNLAPIDLTVHERIMYETAWNEFRKELNLARKGKDPKGGLAAQLRFRQKASLIRVDGTLGYIEEALENGHQVAVSVQFIETLDAIAERLQRKRIPYAIIDGRAGRNKEAERIAFQKGEAKVVLFTVTEGISLHADEALPDGTQASAAPRSLLVHDARYSGIDTLQIEGRCHRDGRFARATYLYSARTVEEDIVRVLLGRIATTKELVGDDVSTLNALQSVLEKGVLGQG